MRGGHITPIMQPHGTIFINLALLTLYHTSCNYGIIFLLCTPITILTFRRIGTQKGGRKNLEQCLLNLGISILASVIAYYVCKWLDSRL